MLISIIALSVILCLIVFFVSAFISSFLVTRRWSPFYPSPADRLHKGLVAAGLKPGDVFYDFGAGTGKMLLLAEKDFKARAKGFEFALLFYTLGNINLFLHRSTAKLYFKNFFDADVFDANVIFCFLLPPVLRKLRLKFENECKPGTVVISYLFPFDTAWIPEKTIPFDDGKQMFLYRIESRKTS